MNRINIVWQLIIFFSCDMRFNPREYNGSWVYLNQNKSFSSAIPPITFKNDSVYLEDIYGYITKGNYKIKSNSITFYLKNDTITSKYDFSSKDSTLKIGKNKYYLWEEYFHGTKILTYDLINLQKEKNITVDSLRMFDNGFHLFKDCISVNNPRLN